MKILFESEIAIVACLKNESPYIEEWLEYHYRIGIDKFYLYDNDSEDRSELKKILEPWIAQKIVEYVEFYGELAQIPAYNDAILKHRFDCRYLAFIDLDEFIVPKHNQAVLDIINSLFQTQIDPQMRIGGIGINWRNFGSNGQDQKIDGGVLERFTKRSPDDFARNKVIKTISNPRRVKEIHRAHDAIYFLNCTCVNENGNKISEFENPENTVAKLQINHYFTKSREEFMAKKSRGRADCQLRYRDQTFDDYQHDEIEDLTALKLFNQFFRFHNINDDQSTIRDLKLMLESDLSIEKLLTCFHRARKLKDESRRDEFIQKSLEKLIQTPPKHISEQYLLFDSMPEIISAKTRFSGEIFRIAVKLLENLEFIMRKNLCWTEMMDLRRKKDMLKSFL
ncbi:MAG: glycosyltransferase family 92 protein [Selenomonadaceae bacterium]|nr:glycosyltransferase family 92 protein [Selenomonadaceae bacterium]